MNKKPLIQDGNRGSFGVFPRKRKKSLFDRVVSKSAKNIIFKTLKKMKNSEEEYSFVKHAEILGMDRNRFLRILKTLKILKKYSKESGQKFRIKV